MTLKIVDGPYWSLLAGETASRSHSERRGSPKASRSSTYSGEVREPLAPERLPSR